jgi:HlyD family secretion protein
VHILGAHSWLKPGMNAKVEIIVDQLADVLYVPVQSIEVEDDHHFCYVNSGTKMVRREIATGLFNDEFIEVRNGLQQGELVALSLPKRVTAEDAKGTSTSPAPESPAEPAKPQGKAKAKNVAAAG